MRPPVSGLTLAALSALALVASALLEAATPPTASAAQDSARRALCRGPGSLGGYFQLVDRRKIVGKRTNCKTARKVVKRYPRSCAGAYAAQGRCRIRASGRWRCSSRIAGPLTDGAPSKQKCKRRRSKLKFEVALFPPTEPAAFGRAFLRGPYDDTEKCIDTSEPGRVVPPPDLSAGTWEIRLTRGVNRRVGQELQRALIARRVDAILHAGLGSRPRNYPNRIPIYITRGSFNRAGSLGVASETCDDPSVDGIVVTAAQKKIDIAATAAHELFHAYSLGITGLVPVPWWEEASATWSEAKLGFPEATIYDVVLQYPKSLTSWRPKTYPYGMARFVQFLDAGDLIGAPAWSLQRQVLNGYRSPGATARLAAALEGRTTLGVELASFWGDRLRATPRHGPQLRPRAHNAKRITVRPGIREISVKADRLGTVLVDFKLARNVRRVGFEFEPPAQNGFFWGLVSPNDSRPFGAEESISFCVGGADEDDLAWPGHFPVTYTNGALSNGLITGTIVVDAESDDFDCTSPTLNRACRVLDRAGAGEIIGRPGTFEAITDDPSFGNGSHLWQCFYSMDPLTDPGRDALLTLVRYRRSKEARRAIRALIERAGYRPIDLGDAGAIYTDSSNAVAAVALRKDYAAVQVDNEVGRRGALALARGFVRRR